MLLKLILLIGITCLLSRKVYSNTLQCYECDPGNLQFSHQNSHMTQMKCLTNDDDFGELKRCQAFDGACAKAKLKLNDNEITIRRCQQNSVRKVDTCEDVEMMGVKTTSCYCGTNGCNDTNQVRPGSYITLVAICGVLMLMAKI